VSQCVIRPDIQKHIIISSGTLNLVLPCWYLVHYFFDYFLPFNTWTNTFIPIVILAIFIHHQLVEQVKKRKELNYIYILTKVYANIDSNFNVRRLILSLGSSKVRYSWQPDSIHVGCSEQFHKESVYGLECYPLIKSDSSSLEFVTTRVLMKLFKSANVSLINIHLYSP